MDEVMFIALFRFAWGLREPVRLDRRAGSWCLPIYVSFTLEFRPSWPLGGFRFMEASSTAGEVFGCFYHISASK